MSRKRIQVGDVFTNSQGCQAKVVHYKNYREITIEFLDEYKHQKVVQARYLDRGGFDNPYFKSVCGVGFLGFGDYSTSYKSYDEKGQRIYPHTPEYYIWSAMIRRCYSEYSVTANPTYVDVVVAEEWHDFQNFAKWYKERSILNESYHIDKDLLSGEQKVYSPETCCLVPIQVNNLIKVDDKRRTDKYIGAYKQPSGNYVALLSVDDENQRLGCFDCQEKAHRAYVEAKESHVKEVAREWRGRIDERVYNALMNWRVKK